MGTSHADNLARGEAKRRAVLEFLRLELWTATDVLRDVMGVKTNTDATATLRKYERAGLVVRHPFTVDGRKVATLWGITPHGQGMAFDIESGEPQGQAFEPSKVAPTTVPHRLETHRARLLAERAGWSDWLPGERLGKKTALTKKPDALVTDADGQRVAIEVERTLKSRKRYAELISMHLQARTKGEWGRVLYLSPTPEIAARLRRMFESIEAVPVKHEGQTKRVPLQASHRQAFTIQSYQEFREEMKC